MRFTIRSSATDEVLRWCDVPVEFSEAQVQAGEYLTEGWLSVAPSVVLERARIEATTRLASAREAAYNSGFDYAGKKYASGVRAVQHIILTDAAKRPPATEDFDLVDGGVSTLDAVVYDDLAMALLAHLDAVAAHWRAVRAQIFAATTIDELNAIAW